MRSLLACVKVAVLVVALACGVAHGQVVSHLNLVSDKSQDVSTLDAWRKTNIKDGMSEQDKAIAIFNTIAASRAGGTVRESRRSASTL
ncbi:MAG: hypothetical protein M3478_11890 [Planctomycetota bacterium]|nr:hypothetical protein [Planctomycetota bacterium]